MKLKIFIFSAFLCCLSFNASLKAHPLNNSEHSNKEDLIVISPAPHNFFFKSIISKLMKLSGYDYVTIQRPSNRAIAELEDGSIHVAGPYAQSLFQQAFVDGNTINLNNDNWLIRWEGMDIYPVTMEGRFSFTSLDDLKNLRVGYLFNHFHPSLKGDTSAIRAKNLQQLVALLKSKRIDVALMSSQQTRETQNLNSDYRLHIGKLPLIHEKQYLIVGNTDNHFIEHFQDAMAAMKKTDYYQIRCEKFGESPCSGLARTTASTLR